MRHGIPQFRARQPLDRQLSAATLNDIRKELESLRITNVVNGSFRKLPGGTEIVVAPQRAASSTQPQPWDLIARRDAESSAYILTVQPGTLNGILPSNYDDQFTCSASGLFYAKAVLTTDGRDITGVTIAIDQTAPTIQDAQPFAISTTIEMLFGLFSDGEKLRVVGDGHITMQSQVWLTAEKQAAPAVGELPWVNYYRLT